MTYDEQYRLESVVQEAIIQLHQASHHVYTTREKLAADEAHSTASRHALHLAEKALMNFYTAHGIRHDAL